MTDLWVERTGVRRYTGHSSRGAEVLVGSEDVEGVFTPGELLKIALAACSGMSSDSPLARPLGDEKLEVRLSGLDPEEKTRLLTVVRRAVDQVCTVGRTLKAGTTVDFRV